MVIEKSAEDVLLNRDRCWVCFTEHPVDGHRVTCPWTSESQITADDLEGVSRSGFLRWLFTRAVLERFLALALARLVKDGETTFDTASLASGRTKWPTPPLSLETHEERVSFAKMLCDAFEEETNVLLGRRLQEKRDP